MNLLNNNFWVKYFYENLELSRYPEKFKNESSKGLFYRELRISLVFLTTYIVINILLSFLHYHKIQKVSEGIVTAYKAGQVGWSLYYMNVFPFNILFLFILIIVFQIYSILISHFTMVVFGEKNRSILLLSVICMNSFFYILLSLIPISLLFNLFPGDYKEGLIGLVLFTSLNMMIFLIGFLFYGYFHIRLTKSFFGQNTGRAFLTLVTPLTLIICYFYIIMK